MIKAFIFDLDGVITDTAEFHYKAWGKLAEGLEITIDREFNEQLKGVSRMDSLERILALGSKENSFTPEDKRILATKKNKHYQKLISTLTPTHILPGIKDLILDMKTKSFQLGLASASKNAVAVLHSLGLLDMFDAIADAAAVANSKPAPDIFLLAAHKLGVDPSQCIGIEDAESGIEDAESGIEAIQKANMFAVGVGDADSLRKADYFVQSTELLSVDQMIATWRVKIV